MFLLIPLTAHVFLSLKVTHTLSSAVSNSRLLRGLNLQYTYTLPATTGATVEGGLRKDYPVGAGFVALGVIDFEGASFGGSAGLAD